MSASKTYPVNCHIVVRDQQFTVTVNATAEEWADIQAAVNSGEPIRGRQFAFREVFFATCPDDTMPDPALEPSRSGGHVRGGVGR